jgi:transposase
LDEGYQNQTLKKVPGRKTDVSDAQWLAMLARSGLLRGSFIPPEHLRHLHLLARQHNGILARRFRRVPEIPFCFGLISVAFAT